MVHAGRRTGLNYLEILINQSKDDDKWGGVINDHEEDEGNDEVSDDKEDDYDQDDVDYDEYIDDDYDDDNEDDDGVDNDDDVMRISTATTTTMRQ